MIRVLHYIPGFLFGGIESMYLTWFQNIDPRKVQFELLLRTQDENAPALVKYRDLGGVYYRLPALSWRGLRDFEKAVYAFFSVHHNYDILHVHGENPFILRAAKKYGIKRIIVHSHTAPSGNTTRPNIKDTLFHIDAKITRLIYADRGFACSEPAALWKFGSLEFKGKKVQIIRNAIQAELYDYNPSKRKELREKLNIQDRNVIGHVGRMTYAKNQFFLLDIFCEYLKTNPNAILLMVGDGPDEDELKNYAKEIQINDHTRFLGVRNDIPDLLQVMDCFLLPSRYEGLPVTIIEAQTSGLPCLISDAITHEVDLTDAIRRLSVEDDPVEWARAINECIAPDNRKSRVENIIEAGFDVKTEVIKLMTLYSDVLNSNK